MTMTIDSTTGTRPDAAPAPGALGRIRDVVRLHFVSPGAVLTWPLIILAAIFVVNLVIWWLVRLNAPVEDRADVAEGLQWSGASLFIFIYMMVVAVQAMNQTFGYALGMSVTRRDYYLGSAAAFTLLSAIFTAILVTLGVIERATGGWGADGRMFSAVYFGDGSIGQSAFTIGSGFMFFFFIGSFAAGVYTRWRARGLTILLIGVSFLGLAAAVVVTYAGAWPAFGSWVLEHGGPGIAAWLWVGTIASAVAGFFVLRGATPRS
jgi:hypothetical protein